jgi:phenylpyruvate tautomerase PptA (4-oxalocrotonate tautomerase family)
MKEPDVKPPRRVHTIERSAVVDDTPVAGNLTTIKTPKGISLVESPANQTGFKVLRDAEGAPTEPVAAEPTPARPLVRRARRSEASPVMRLSFPAGTSSADVEASLKTYGMQGYKVTEENGVYVALRADLTSISKDQTLDIKLTEAGLVATVARQDSATNAGDKRGVTLAAVEFDAEKFTQEDVQRWVAEKAVDGTLEETQNSPECYVVRRSQVPEGEETRRLVLEDGITAVIMRSADMSVPEGHVAIINEAAYGNWGWGQLDFTAAMADREFCEAVEQSMSRLQDILHRIMFYSDLPLSLRKELVMRAMSQFGDYVGTVMDSLPRQLMAEVARSANPLQQEQPMTQATSGAATPEAKPNVTEATAAPVAAAAPAETPVTRAELATMVAEAVTAALAQRAAAPATPAAAPAAVVAAPVAEAGITRADLAAAFAEAMKPLAEKVETLASQTVLRSAEEQVAAAPAADSKEKDVFRGTVPGLSSLIPSNSKKAA